MNSTNTRHRLVVLLFSWFGVLQAQAEGTDTSSSSNTADNNPIIQWLRSKEGGYFSEKIGLEDQSGAGGMFALQDIAEGEHLMTIPPTALLIGEVEDPEDDDEDEDGFGRDSCLTAKRLFKEYAILGESKSDYWPYVRYVFESFPHETVPMGWSQQAKRLIRDIAGEELDPQGFGSGSYLWSCGYQDGRDLDNEYADDDTIDPQRRLELLEAAWRIVEARGWYHVLVPVLDMVNHRNGKWLNVDRDGYDEEDEDTVLDVEDDYKVIALRDIPKGTPLHNSYNQCLDITCLGIDKVYLTPGVFADYGFVEQYPRRFTFHTGHEPEPEDSDEDDDEGASLGLLIEIDIVEQEDSPNNNNNNNNNNNDDNPQQLGITFLNGEPNSDQIAWVRKERKRLVDLDVEGRSKALTNTHEATMSLAYYNALVSAMDLVIEAGPTEEVRTEL